MNIYITDKNEVRSIRLVRWDWYDSQHWGPDFFGEISNTAEQFPISRHDRIEHDAEAAMTDAEFREEVAWWEEQVNLYNDHDRSGWFTEDMDEDEANEEFSKESDLCLIIE